MIVADIETGPLPAEQLFALMPSFEAPANYSDPAKIMKAVEEKREAWKAKAALSPLTGTILAIGLKFCNEPDEEIRIITGQESAMLETFWSVWSQGSRFVGFNVRDFDFRYLEIRSRILNVPIPDDLHEGRYWSRRIVCLLELFTCYSRETSGFSLDAICKACGIPGKLEGMSGADFARVFAEDRDRAILYLKADLEATAALAARLGIQ